MHNAHALGPRSTSHAHAHAAGTCHTSCPQGLSIPAVTGPQHHQHTCVASCCSVGEHRRIPTASATCCGRPPPPPSAHTSRTHIATTATPTGGELCHAPQPPTHHCMQDHGLHVRVRATAGAATPLGALAGSPDMGCTQAHQVPPAMCTPPQVVHAHALKHADHGPLHAKHRQ